MFFFVEFGVLTIPKLITELITTHDSDGNFLNQIESRECFVIYSDKVPALLLVNTSTSIETLIIFLYKKICFINAAGERDKKSKFRYNA